MALTKVKLIADGVITSANLDASHGITTSDIGEGSNLYYTDSRVSSYLSTNGFATQTDIVAAITDSAPVTLDTLNELAAALGDDPNFATTTATSLGLKAPLASPSFTGNATFAGSVTLSQNGTNFEHGQAGNGLVLSHYNVGPSNAIVSGGASNPDTLFINNGGSASDWSNVVITGNVGIGITSPSSLLHLYGADATVEIQGLGVNSTAGVTFFPRDGSDVAHLQSVKGVGSSLTFLTGGNSGNSYVPTERMRITSAGNIGISGDTSAWALGKTIQINGNYGTINYSGVSAILGIINAYYNGSAYIRQNVGYAGSIDFNTAVSGGGFAFRTENTTGAAGDTVTLSTKMAITSAGNVGIGETNPGTKLHIKSSTYDDFIKLERNGIGAMGISATNPRGIQTTDGAGSFLGWHVDSSGSVGISTTSPTNGKLEVQQTATTAALWVQTGGTTDSYTIADFRTGTNAPALAIKGNGRVGIGTTSPLELLNVHQTTATAGLYMPISIAGARYQADYAVGIAFRPENNASAYAAKTAIVGSGGGYGYNMADLHFCFNNSTTITDEVSLSDAKVTMKRSGNVGIGTTSPSYTFTVAKSITNDWVGLINNTYDGAGNGLLIDAGNGTSGEILRLRDRNGNSKVSFLSNGRVGIGNTNPQAALDISSSYSIQGGVYTYYYTGTATGQSNINLDITVNNEGGGGNVFKIEAGFAHYSDMSYNSIGEWWCTSRGTSVVNTYILNAGSTNAGTWSSSKPTTSVLRITKSAGTYVGGGKYWVKVTYRPY